MAREDLVGYVAGAQVYGAMGTPELAPPSDALAVRARQWFLEAYNHPFWKTFRLQAEEDLGFYLGGERQWYVDGSDEDLQRLKELERVVVSVNHIRPVIKLLSGYERQNRSDPHAVPQGDEDVETAQLWSLLLKFHADQIELPEQFSEQFENGAIQGLSVMAVEADWDDDLIRGTIECSVLWPGRDLIWDPTWVKYDFSDCRYVLRFKWAYVDDVVAQYPEHEATIKAAVAELDLVHQASAGISTTDGPKPDAYGSVRSHPIETVTLERLFYDPTERKLLILEPWYRDYDVEHFVTDKRSGKVTEVDSEAIAKELVTVDPENLKAVKVRRAYIRMGVVLPATYQVLEDGDSPYENDRKDYPFIPFIGERKGEHVYGEVRNLKDPQRIENKRISQILDIVGKYANIRQFYYEKSLLNPEAIQDPHSTSPIGIKENQQPPGFLVPPLAEITRVLTELAGLAKLWMRESSGMNPDLLGLRSDDSSGIAIGRRQAQGQVIATPLFDNFRRTRKLVYQRLARRIQQVMTTEQYVRLTNEMGQSIVVLMNPSAAKGLSSEQFKQWQEELRQQGKPAVLRDVSQLKYDIAFSEAPASPTARATQLLMLLELLGKVPAIWPAIIDIVVQLTDVPRREEILQRLQQIVAQQTGAAPGGGPPGAPGAPPGGPPGAPPGGPQSPQGGGVSPELRRAVTLEGAGAGGENRVAA